MSKNNKAYSETPMKGNTMKTFETNLVILETPQYDITVEMEAKESAVKVKSFLDTLNIG